MLCPRMALFVSNASRNFILSPGGVIRFTRPRTVIQFLDIRARSAMAIRLRLVPRSLRHGSSRYLCRWRRRLLRSTARNFPRRCRFGIGVVAIVFNDRAYGNVRRGQREMFGGRLIASDLRNPDFEKFVGSFGMNFWKCDSPETLAPALDAALAAGRPAFIEVTRSTAFRTRSRTCSSARSAAEWASPSRRDSGCAQRCAGGAFARASAQDCRKAKPPCIQHGNQLSEVPEMSLPTRFCFPRQRMR